MRMQVAENITERGEFMNGVISLDSGIETANHPGRPPPPPILGGPPLFRHACRRRRQPLDGDPTPKAGRADAAGPHELQYTLQICEEDEQKGGPQSSKDGASELTLICPH